MGVRWLLPGGRQKAISKMGPDADGIHLTLASEIEEQKEGNRELEMPVKCPESDMCKNVSMSELLRGAASV